MTEIFTQTSHKPYDRHNYKLVYENGKEVIFDNYEDVYVTWFQKSGYLLKHIEVLDKKQSKSKGFG